MRPRVSNYTALPSGAAATQVQRIEITAMTLIRRLIKGKFRFNPSVMKATLYRVK